MPHGRLPAKGNRKSRFPKILAVIASKDRIENDFSLLRNFLNGLKFLVILKRETPAAS